MYNFDVEKPTSIADAVKALSRDEAQPLSGGQTLIPTLKARLAMPTGGFVLAAEPFTVPSPRKLRRITPGWRALRRGSETLRYATAEPLAGRWPIMILPLAIRRGFWPVVRRS